MLVDKRSELMSDLFPFLPSTTWRRWRNLKTTYGRSLQQTPADTRASLECNEREIIYKNTSLITNSKLNKVKKISIYKTPLEALHTIAWYYVIMATLTLSDRSVRWRILTHCLKNRRSFKHWVCVIFPCSCLFLSRITSLMDRHLLVQPYLHAR